MTQVDVDTYVVGGITDHITPWKGCYSTARAIDGKDTTFVLANAGHLQSLINPPGNPKSFFSAAKVGDADSRRVGEQANAPGGQLVAALARLDRPAFRREGGRADKARQPQAPGGRAGARGIRQGTVTRRRARADEGSDRGAATRPRDRPRRSSSGTPARRHRACASARGLGECGRRCCSSTASARTWS